MRFQKFASSSSSLVGKTNFRGMVWSINYSPTHLSLKDVTLCAGHKVLVEDDDTCMLIVWNPLGIFGQHLRPLKIHLLNIIILY
jgi:hypothetical protein